jgi:DNA-binding FadR family transcriptional regulator
VSDTNEHNSGKRSDGESPRVNQRRTEKISEVLAREIVRDMRNLSPGSMLPSEGKLLEKYKVGRASLREALRLLEVQGLIVIRPGPGGGPMVAQVDSSHFGRMATLYFHMAGATYQDVIDAQWVVEPVVAGLVAERQAPEHMRTLEEYLSRSESARPWSPEGTRPRVPIDDEETADYAERSAGFHAMIMSMSGNPVIDLFARALQDIILDCLTSTVFGPEDFADVEEMHHMIAQTMLDGHPARAENLVREHMREYVQSSLMRHPAVLKQVVDWH